jgi:hypothetical protein
MRPYFVLAAVVLLAVAAFGQQPKPYDGCVYAYGCGPSIPLAVTPEISLQQFSPNPVGATNATTGLIAGATNSTLSEIEGSTSSVYTVSVWYQGGAPLITSAVHLSPEMIGREGHIMHQGMHDAMFEQHRREEGPAEFRHEGHPREGHMREEQAREDHHAEEARGEWTYFTGSENTTESTSVVKDYKKAARTYNNDDVTRQNEKNGAVHYDSKTEKI